MIGSHNKPPPPSNDGERAAIAAVNGEPEIPLDVTNGERGAKEPPPPIRDPNPGAPEAEGKEILDGDADVGMDDNPDIILENSTGSIPEGIGVPEAAAAATISAGVGSKVPVIVL